MMSPAAFGPSRSPLTPHLSLREGDLLADRYRIESLLHARPSGALFSATDLSNGTRVTAHVLVTPEVAEGAANDSARVAFLAGARRAKSLSSPHLARVIDVGVTKEGNPWSVREHLGSNTLEAHLRQHGALGTREAVDIALAVCDAIADAHAHDVLHLSLGPQAVHVAWSASGLSEVKVTGAGTASAEAALALGARNVECILRSPEQLRLGSKADARADVWATGVLLHTMLAGAPPFSADTPSGASLSVIIDEPPSLAGVPDALADIVERTLAKDPDQRPRTILDLAEAIAGFSSNATVARERVAKRRGLMLVMPAESDPTLIVDGPEYTELAKEQKAKSEADALDTDPPTQRRAPAPVLALDLELPSPGVADPRTTLAASPAPPAKPMVIVGPASPLKVPALRALLIPAPAGAELGAPRPTPKAKSAPPPPSAKKDVAGAPLATTSAPAPSTPPPVPSTARTASAPALSAPPPPPKPAASAPPPPPKASAPAASAPPPPKASAPPAPSAPTKPNAPLHELASALDSDDVISDPAPSVRSLVPSEIPPPILPTLVKVEAPKKKASRFTAAQAFKAVGVMAAAACITLVVLASTDKARLSQSAPAKETATAANVAAAAPPPATPVNELPAPVIRPSDLPAAPPTATTPVQPQVVPAARAHEPAPVAKGRPSASSPAAPAASPTHQTSPASQPSQSGSADDLRRFLDDRR